jgi:hypothetical protein
MQAQTLGRMGWEDVFCGSRARSPSIYGSQKWTLFVTLFWAPLLRNPFRLALMDPTDRYLRAWELVPLCLRFNQQCVLSRFFSLLPPSPSSNGRLLHHHGKTKSHG